MASDAHYPTTRGWYRDPFERFEFRYWDGTKWRAEVKTHGRQLIDPLAWPTPTLLKSPEPALSPPIQADSKKIPSPPLKSSTDFSVDSLTSDSLPDHGGLGREGRNDASLVQQAAIVGTASVVAGVAMPAAEHLAQGLAALVFLAAFLLASWAVLSGLYLLLLDRGPRRPSMPKLPQARRPRIPREPKKQIPELSSRCVICGRALTNAQSMRARVGSTCIKTYGPRYAWTANPQHIAWRRLLAAAEASRAAEQARLNAAHAEAMATYPRLVSVWENERTSVTGQARAARQAVGCNRLIVGGVVAPLGVFAGLAVAVPFFF